MATLLGHDDPRVRAAIEESRQLFERMGAGLWLARLEALAAEHPDTGRPAAAAPVGDAIPR